MRLCAITAPGHVNLLLVGLVALLLVVANGMVLRQQQAAAVVDVEANE